MGMLVVSLPGSIKAIELALRDILLPEVGHMLHETRKTGPLG
jgi:molybdopterin biosynthesis enzyme MoaB